MSSGFEVAANTLLQQARKENPATADTLKIIVDEIRRVGIIVDPPPPTLTKPHAPIDTVTPDVIAGSYRFTPFNLILEWVPPSTDTFYYEVRKGTNWATAPRVTVTNNFLALLEPITIGTHIYLVKAINTEGIYSANPVTITVVVPNIGGFSITARTISNNVMLFWTEPTIFTFDIDHYLVDRESVNIGNIRGTFTSYTETVGGNINFFVTPVDIVGNLGPRIGINVPITPPADFELQGTKHSIFNGEFVDTDSINVNGEPILIGPLYAADSWATHFTRFGYDQISDQIAAGYPLYIQPTNNAYGTYYEVFDFGLVFSSSLINVAWNYYEVIGSLTIGCRIYTSLNGTTFTKVSDSQTAFAQNFRYVAVTIEIDSADYSSYVAIVDFSVSISVKREIDSGTVFALLSDVNGTVCTFTKAFKDVDSITTSSKSVAQPYTVIHNFIDIPNPVNFTVYVYDSAGNRVSERVDWKARGIL